MSSKVQVQSVEAIEALQSRMSQFETGAKQALVAANHQIGEAVDWLRSRLRYWQREVQIRRQEVSRAAAALAGCQASGYRDDQGRYHAPDCSAYTHALAQARAQLHEAETELNNAQLWSGKVDAAAAAYRREAQRLSQTLDSDLPHAVALLQRKIASLKAYLAATAVGGVAGPSVTQKRKAVERAAEAAARSKLYRLGYDSVVRMQHDSIHGVDLGAIKYDKKGRPVAGAVIEVKGRSGPTPGPSAFKKQVRAGYYMPRLLQAKRAGVRGADDLYRLAKARKVVSYGATYGQQGLRLYQVPRRGPIPKRPI